MASGIDYNRAMLLLAVLEKRAGLLVSNADVYINVVGGLRIDEPAADLATVVALASSVRDRPVCEDTVIFGEVGLTGELRRVSGLEQRFAEAARLSIGRCVCPSMVLPSSSEGWKLCVFPSAKRLMFVCRILPCRNKIL